MNTLESLATGSDTKQACLALVERLAARFGGDAAKKTHAAAIDKKQIEECKRQGLITVAPPVVSVMSEKSRERSRARYFYKKQKFMDTKPLNPDVTAAIAEILAHIGPRPHGYIKSVARKHNVKYSTLIARYYAHFHRLQIPVPKLAKKEGVQ